MRLISVAPLLFVLSCLPAKAEEIGRGVLCDTAEQVQHFVTLRNDGLAPQAALHVVNDEAKKTTACSYTMVIFTSDMPIADLTIKGRRIHILQITVMAFGDGRTWKWMPGMVQYTAVVEKGFAI